MLVLVVQNKLLHSCNSATLAYLVCPFIHVSFKTGEQRPIREYINTPSISLNTARPGRTGSVLLRKGRDIYLSNMEKYMVLYETLMMTHKLTTFEGYKNYKIGRFATRNENI